MDYGLKGKTAFVGGASRGLGRAVAAALGREGARVAICARNLEDIDKAARELAAETGAEFVPIQADLSIQDNVEWALELVKAKLGQVEILVANAGGPRPGKFSDLEPRDWDQGYDLLLKSAVLLLRGFLPAMKERKWGRIIGITSVAVKEPIENLLLSNVFRSGLTALFKSLSREVAQFGITVNTVLPGLTDTARLKALYAGLARSRGLTTEQYLDEVAQGLPLKRLNRPDELAALVAFLASDAASGITGCAIPADGGQFRGLM